MTKYSFSAMDRFHKASWMSFSLTAFPSILYSLSPERKTRWLMMSSSLSSARKRATSAMPNGDLWVFPLKIISSLLSPFSDFALWPPRTQRRASTMLLFPVPFGPTMAVMPGWKMILVRSGNDLNPWSSIFFMNMLWTAALLGTTNAILDFICSRNSYFTRFEWIVK